MRPWAGLQVGIPILALLLLVGWGCNGAPGRDDPLGGGVRAPEFALRDLSGRIVRLSDYRGRVVVLNFWATWCAPCRVEIPMLQDLHSRYRNKRLAVLGVALDAAGPEALEDFADEMGIDYPILRGDEKVSSDYGGIFGVPTTFLIDAEGRIAGRHVGLVEGGVLEREILALLKK